MGRADTRKSGHSGLAQPAGGGSRNSPADPEIARRPLAGPATAGAARILGRRTAEAPPPHARRMSTTINNMLARQLRFRAWREANAGTEADQRLSQLLARLKHAGAPDEAQWEVIGQFINAAVPLSAPPPPAESFLSASELALGTPLPSDVFEQILADMDRVALMPPRTDPTPLRAPTRRRRTRHRSRRFRRRFRRDQPAGGQPR